MPEFSATSKRHLSEVDPDLQRLFNFVIRHWDCTIIDGKRTVDEQEKNVARGVSKTMESKHLPQADGHSHAVDAMPYPIDWSAITKGIAAVKKVDPGLQTLEAYAFHGFVLGAAAAFGISVRSGIDWDGDREQSEHSFIDLPHYEKVTR